MIQPTAKAVDALGQQKPEGKGVVFCAFACLYKPAEPIAPHWEPSYSKQSLEAGKKPHQNL